MRNRRYYLKANKGSEAPSNLLFFDTESHWRGNRPSSGATVHTLKLWCAIACRLENGKITREERRTGTTPESFWEFVAERQLKTKPLWVFAHNLGFDLTLLHFWEALEHGIFTVGPIEREPHPETGKEHKPWVGKLCLEGRPTFAIVQGAKGKVKFVDTSNYWPSRLESIGAKFGLPKLSIDFATCTDDELTTYCFRDCEICQLAVCDLMTRWTQEGSGIFQMTAASLALTNWRHTCDCRTPDGERLTVVMEPGHPATVLERRGYYGGRVEPFFLGVREEPIYALDVNSLYLGVMSSNRFPRARLRQLHDTTPEELYAYMHAYGAVADVYLETQNATYPTRPHGVQLHARGQFHTTLSGPELFRALKNGHVKKVHECWLYLMAPLFKTWATYWYNRKCEAQHTNGNDSADAEFAKLVGNSLSGKFGQRGEYWKDTPEVPCVNMWGEWTEYDCSLEATIRYRGVAGKTQTLMVGDEPGHSFPAISAYITSYAREYMRSLFALCPPKSILYSATDSIICTQAGYDALLAANKIHPYHIGELKVKGKYHYAKIMGCNWYQLDDWLVQSGSVAKVRPADDGTPTADLWQGLPSIIGERPTGRVLVRHVQLQHFDPTPKGIKQEDGFVEPYWLTNDPDFGDKPPKKKRLNFAV